jgi:Transposase domain (DUF772)
MFDAAVLARPLPEGSFFALLAEHGHRIVRDDDFAECYSSSRGRPSIPPSLPAKVMLLQHRTGLSDEAAMAAVAWDLRWKITLGLAVDHDGFHPTSLTKFRAWLLLHGKEALALEATLRVAEEIGLLDGTAEQIIDSTPMLGAAATQDTVRLVRHGVRKLLDAVAAVDEDAGERLDDGLEFDYARPGEKPDCRWRENAERERMLTRVAEDAERALQAVEQADGLLDDDRIADAHALLRELIGQDFDIDSDGVPRLHRGTRARSGSSRPSTRRCAMAARVSTSALTATSSRRRRPTRPRRWSPRSTSHPPQSRTARRPRLSSTPSPKRAAPSGCSATPPTGPARSAPSSPSATSRCSRRCLRARPRTTGWPSATSPSICRPGR